MPMDNADHIILDFDDFDTVFHNIKIPQNTILLRGYDKAYAAISERPAYFTSNVDVASAYGNKLGVYVSRKPLKVYDLRFVGAILLDLLSRRKSTSKEVVECIYTLTLSYGLCSFTRQLELFDERYRNVRDKFEAEIRSMTSDLHSPNYRFNTGINPVEPKGIRIGETTNDSQ